jgi:hypothetical protein
MATHAATGRVSKALPWVAGLVLIAGVVAFAVVYFGNSSESVDSQLTATDAGAVGTNASSPNVKLDPEARRIAGEFILTAVVRKNLKRSYEITHPTLRQGLTLKEWLTGNIPVVFYPAAAIETATFSTEISKANEALLQVALLPKQGAAVKPQVFYIGLKKVDGEWLVDYWAPRGSPAIPVIGE